MSEQKPRKFMSKALLATGLCGVLIYLQMGGFEEVQTIVEQQWTSFQHAAVDAGAMPKGQAPASQQTAVAPGVGKALPSGADKTPSGQSGASAGADGARPPSFDVARAEPTGELVIAGKAEPEWTVHLKSGGKTIAETQADSSGAWVMTPDKPLGEGVHSLELSAASKDGAKSLEGGKAAQVTVPKRKSERPVVAMAQEAGQPEVKAGASKPEMSKSEASKGEAPNSMGGQLAARSAGAERSAPTASSRAATEPSRETGVKESGSKEIASRESGGKEITGKSGAKVGSRHSSGAVGSTRSDHGDDEALEETGERRGSVHHRKHRRLARRRTYTVNPGDSLWRIAKRVYGSGASYTKIYRSNRDRIDDPDLIYPSQRITLSR